MKIYFEYGREAVTLPKIDRTALMRAGKTELRLLLALCQSQETFDNFDIEKLGEELKLSPQSLDSALSFWIGAGVISISKEKGEKRIGEPKATVEIPKRTKVTELPQYTGEEFTAVLERRRELKGLIEEAQDVLEKVFNITETQLLVSIYEGLGLDEEYILNLLAYCKRIGKANMRYVEKTAVSLYDKGVCTAGALAEYLRSVDKLTTAEGKIRKIFGLGERAFTAKESKFVSDWINTYGFDIDVISKAYEDTVNATSKPSLNYANKILESWYAQGLRNAAEVEAYHGRRSGESAGASSFDVDDFFKAAINKGFGEPDKKEV